jgi:hypothetical protein
VPAERLLSRGPDEAAVPRVILWSPAVDHSAGMSGRLCDAWPDAALYTIVDEAGISRAYAASPRGERWTPAIPPERWTVTPCAQYRAASHGNP